MPYQNDMSTLADVVSPVYAATQAGISNDQANQEEMAKAAVAQATVPAEIQKPYLANIFSAAQGAGEQGVAAQERAKGAIAQALVPTEIGAGQAAGQTKITQAHVEQLQNLGQVVGQLDQSLQGMPDAARPSAVAQFLDSNAVQDPGIRQLMINAASQPGGLQQISQGLFNASNTARQASLAENIRGGYQLGTAQIGAQGRLASAEATANARVQAANVMAQMRQNMSNFEQAAVQAERSGNHALAQQYAQAALQQRQAMAGINNQLLFGEGMQTPIGGGNIPAGSNNQGQPAAQPQAPQQPPVEDAVTAEMRKRGLLK